MAQQRQTAPLTPPTSPITPPVSPTIPPTAPPTTLPLPQQSRHQKLFANFFAAGSPNQIKVDNPYRKSKASNQRPRLPKSQHFLNRAESIKSSSTKATKPSNIGENSKGTSATTNGATSEHNESPKKKGTIKGRENKDDRIKNEVLNDALLYEDRKSKFYERETNYFDLQFQAELEFIEGKCVRIE